MILRDPSEYAECDSQPRGRLFATVEFALPHGGTTRQRIAYSGKYEAAAPMIVTARKAAESRGVDVANVIKITHKGTLIFDYVTDTAWRLR